MDVRLRLQVNTAIDSEPALVNSSPEDKAWFVKVEMSNPEEVKGLMDAAAYKAFCESEAAHH
ncbi:hypothetical protein EON67_03410 [archaeon]|nr:MAG: hypothetical protein EON67_03410 [archaeon]